jgi:hypothetical protein
MSESYLGTPRPPPAGVTRTATSAAAAATARAARRHHRGRTSRSSASSVCSTARAMPKANRSALARKLRASTEDQSAPQPKLVAEPAKWTVALPDRPSASMAAGGVSTARRRPARLVARRARTVASVASSGSAR